ncbi:MAG TPA: FAD-binding protein [Candidatus Limnocylindria bacterium]|nr:FAD-binding protein [Candidatus Limnocylindria bacterium]
MSARITSYDGGVVATPRRIVRPRSVEELQAILRDTERYPGPVRPMGSFHSLTPCAATDGTLISTTGLDRIVDIDPQAMTVTAQGGVQLVDAAAALRERGLQFMLNLEIGNLTLGSAACCHTKDSLDGIENGQASSYATRIRWVTPSGELEEASQDDAERIALARSSYGLCGVVHEATFRIKPLEVVRFDYELVDVRGLSQDAVSEIIATNDSVVFWTVGRHVVVQTRNVAARSQRAWLGRMRGRLWRGVGAVLGRAFSSTAGTPLQNPIDAAWPVVQRLPYRFLSMVGGFSLHAPDKMMDYRRTPPPGRYAFTFWAFPRGEWVTNLKAFLDFTDDHQRRHGFRCNLPLGSYFIRRDTSSILSYSYDGDIISIDPIHAPSDRDRPAWERFLREFNRWAHERGGIPLLNQSPFIGRDDVAAAYGERWTRFSEWVRAQDPHGRMLNPFFAELLA